MRNHRVKGRLRSLKHSDVQLGRPRVAARLEGVVKNRGTRPKKKLPKQVKYH